MLGVSKTCREIKNRIHEIQQDRELLNAENAKLRELAVEMYWDLVAEMPESLLMDRKQQLKELGIEVDAWHAKDGSRFSLPTFPTR